MTTSHIPDIKEPRNIKEALSKSHWVDAMTEEMQALHSNANWKLAPAWPDVNVVSSHWGFKTNLKADGSVERFKARLVAKGYSQIERVDFEDTFSPMVKATTIRIVLSVAITLNWDIK
ncbi:putative mitochondrial protein AtMg00820 [Nicotiana tabacum]|uniref:Mitochondrial protein AtMg00820 n=1 Tax=Nicotiana tabacum TaxID=4097 RepID=A0A1S4B815_TOBAC|nr:PREDICTED: uncharacterized mitochondrial protein AtMg00820-like [Nicotiana tabacum]